MNSKGQVAREREACGEGKSRACFRLIKLRKGLCIICIFYLIIKNYKFNFYYIIIFIYLFFSSSIFFNFMILLYNDFLASSSVLYWAV